MKKTEAKNSHATVPLKAPELVIYACFGLIHLLYTESMWSETPHQLNQHKVRLNVNRVKAERDSTSTESFHVDSVDMESHSELNQYVDVESRMALTQLTGTEIRVN
jgi:hypothetical protein